MVHFNVSYPRISFQGVVRGLQSKKLQRELSIYSVFKVVTKNGLLAYGSTKAVQNN